MKVAAAIAEMLKREGVKFLIGYPVNPIIETAAEADICTIIVRQERIGLHMADAVSRVTSETIGVFTMQHGPGAQNAFGGVAQAYGDSAPIVVLPAGYPRAIAGVDPNFSSALNMRNVTKTAEQVLVASAVEGAMRSRFHRGRERQAAPDAGRGAGRFVRRGDREVTYRPVPRTRSGPDPRRSRRWRRC